MWRHSEVEEHFRTYQDRVVFQGSRVFEQYPFWFSCDDLGRSPATIQAANAADVCRRLPGRVVEVASTQQAYMQADLRGTSTLVRLPLEERIAWRSTVIHFFVNLFAG